MTDLHQKERREDVESLLPLTVPVYQILLSLVDNDLHGYAMIQDIRERTEGEVDLTASTLYAALKRLLRDGLVKEIDAPREARAEDSRRRYYRVTGQGQDVLRAEARRLERALRLAREKAVLASD